MAKKQEAKTEAKAEPCYLCGKVAEFDTPAGKVCYACAMKLKNFFVNKANTSGF